MYRKLTLALLTALSLVAPATAARADTTRVWVSTTFEDFGGGKGEGVLVTSAGRLERGDPVRRVDLGSVSMVFALHEEGGSLYLGTGTSGEIWRYRGGQAQKLAALPNAILVTCFAKGPGQTIYAGTLPEGRIYALDTASGQATLFSTVAAKHVWALSYDARSRTLFAATGPKGQLFAVDAAGRSRVYWDSGERHLLSLARGPGAALYAGSNPKAILWKILGPGKARALHDFAGNEVRALAGSDKGLYAAVNEIKADRSVDVRFPTGRSPKGTAIQGGASAPQRVPLPRLGAKKGKGGLFFVDADGAASQVYGLTQGYFTAVELAPDGRVSAAEGTQGQVVTILPDRATSIAQNLKERQVLALSLAGRLRALGTGDGGALYLLGPGGKPPTYTSAAYDTGNVSRFGLLAFRADGHLTVEARSGNTAEPDAGWSPFRAVARRGRGADGVERATLPCPPGRYVQYRFLWAAGSRAVVREVRLHFTPSNQAPVVKELTVGETGSGKTAVQKAGWISSTGTAAPNELKIAWKAEDPDGDPLVYRLWFRALGDVGWRRVGNDPVLTATQAKWQTDNLPDGWYEIRLEASDEKSNGAARLRRVEKLSAPVLVDHGKPDLVGLRVAYPVVTGLARDRFSRITGVAWSLDGKVWTQVDALDGVWDQEAERFDFRIAPTLKPGTHTLLVRAYDEAGNARVVKQTLRVR